MTDKPSPAEERATRLAAALRANLRKRKAQARALPEGACDAAAEPPDQPDQ